MADRRSPWPTWQRHPLLFPFLHGRSSELLRLELPEYDVAELEFRNRWMCGGLVASTTDGYQQAALAHLLRACC